MMVAMGHGLCVSFWVSGEMTKTKVGPKKLQCALELVYRKCLARETLANNMARNISDKMLVGSEGCLGDRYGEYSLHPSTFIYVYRL